jgi:hypothetical protein
MSLITIGLNGNLITQGLDFPLIIETTVNNTKKIIAFFTAFGIPQTNLFPTIKITNLNNGDIIVNNELMVNSGDGIYNYDFITYEDYQQYSIICDGGSSLPIDERYNIKNFDSIVLKDGSGKI